MTAFKRRPLAVLANQRIESRKPLCGSRPLVIDWAQSNTRPQDRGIETMPRRSLAQDPPQTIEIPLDAPVFECMQANKGPVAHYCPIHVE
jgi:hypothetical protein